MRLTINRFLLILALAGVLPRARAFSLLGAFDTWMTPEIGYQVEAQIGGPMNLGEEYRWNMPLLTYGFDSAFLNYFGARGVEEVEKAIAIFNALPPASAMSATLEEFPLDTRRFNHRASALYLWDLKTSAMAGILEALGVAPAELYVWTLRSRTVINNIPWYVVLRRNFDPNSWEPSSYVNGALYTYQILLTYPNPTYEAVEFEVDPSVPSVTSVSGFNTWWGGTVYASGMYASVAQGMFFTGLTRDDVAALRYIYRPQNYNVETIPPGAVGAPLGSQRGNYILTADSGQNPWGQPGGTNVLPTTVATNIALRPGVDKVSFVRVNYDSLLGLWVAVTNRYLDNYVVNYSSRQQMIQRTLAQPDILFSAADIGIQGVDGLPFTASHSMNMTNQTTYNNPNLALSGPGNIFSSYILTFSKINEYLVNIGGGGQTDASPVYQFYWGSYDGTTREPVVYPQGRSIKAIEQRVLSGKVFDPSQSPWLAPPTFTPATGDNNTGGTGGGTPTNTGG